MSPFSLREMQAACADDRLNRKEIGCVLWIESAKDDQRCAAGPATSRSAGLEVAARPDAPLALADRGRATVTGERAVKPNPIFDRAKRASDYFTMALHVGIGTGASVGVWEYSERHMDQALWGKMFAGGIGLATCYLGIVFVVSMLSDVRVINNGPPSRLRICFNVLISIAALSVLALLVYFARTTTMEMMR